MQLDLIDLREVADHKIYCFSVPKPQALAIVPFHSSHKLRPRPGPYAVIATQKQGNADAESKSSMESQSNTTVPGFAFDLSNIV